MRIVKKHYREIRRHSEWKKKLHRNPFTVKTGGKLNKNQNKSCCENPKLEIIGLTIQNGFKKYLAKKLFVHLFFNI